MLGLPDLVGQRCIPPNRLIVLVLASTCLSIAVPLEAADRNWNTNNIKDPYEPALWERYKLRHRLESRPEIARRGFEHLARTVLSLRIDLVKIKQKCGTGRAMNVPDSWWLPSDLLFLQPAYPRAEADKFKAFVAKYRKPKYSRASSLFHPFSEFDFRAYVYILRLRINEQLRHCETLLGPNRETTWGSRADLSLDEMTPLVRVWSAPEPELASSRASRRRGRRRKSHRRAHGGRRPEQRAA